MEDRETPLRTAVRETFEETGLTHGKEYTIVGSSIRFGKRPYWLGVVKDNDTKIRLNPKEHCAYGWFTWAEIEKLPMTNMDVRAWVKKSRSPSGNWVHLTQQASVALDVILTSPSPLPPLS